MNINKKSFMEFLDLISVRGELENKELLLNGDNKKIEVLTVSPLQEFSIYASFKGDYEELGKVGIGNIKLLKIFLNNFDSENILLKRKENKLAMFSEDKRLQEKIILGNPSYIANSITPDKFENALNKGIGNEISFSKDDIEKIISFSKSLNRPELKLSSNGEEITLSLENNENEIIYTLPKKEKHSPFDILVSTKLLDILETVYSYFPENIVISIKNVTPMVINWENEAYKIIYLLAQLKQ